MEIDQRYSGAMYVSISVYQLRLCRIKMLNLFFLFCPCRLILEIFILIIDKANCSGTENEKLIYIKVSNNSLKEPVLLGERR